jgi:hypothetical protein
VKKARKKIFFLKFSKRNPLEKAYREEFAQIALRSTSRPRKKIEQSTTDKNFLPINHSLNVASLKLSVEAFSFKC